MVFVQNGDERIVRGWSVCVRDFIVLLERLDRCLWPRPGAGWNKRPVGSDSTLTKQDRQQQ